VATRVSALAGFHFRDAAPVQDHPAMSCTSKCRIFTARRPASRQTARPRAAGCPRRHLVQAPTELGRHGPQLLVGLLLHRWLEVVDASDEWAQTFQTRAFLVPKIFLAIWLTRRSSAPRLAGRVSYAARLAGKGRKPVSPTAPGHGRSLDRYAFLKGMPAGPVLRRRVLACRPRASRDR